MVAVKGDFWARVSDDVNNGGQIFFQQCTSCHSIESQDGRDHDSILRARGPSLANSGDKFVPEWLQKWLQQPVQIWPAGYLSFRHVISTSDGDRIDQSWTASHIALSPEEAHQVASYLLSLKKEPNQYPVSATPSEIPGKLLFQKVLGCGSCHQSEPGQGGQSGPQLYTVSQRLKQEWVREFIADPQYWGSGLMAKTNLGGTQLAAIVNYLYEPKNATPVALQTADAGVKGKAEEVSEAPRARKLYLTFCSQCHGVQGNGKGLNAKTLAVAPRNHTSSDEMAGLTDERLFAAIKFGGTAVGKSSLMPSWATLLTDSDIDALVAYLHKLNGSESAHAVPLPDPVPPSSESRSSR